MRLASALLLALSALGCAAQPSPPVIESVDLPATVAADPATGEYPVVLKIAFHDADDPVTTLRVALPSIGMNYDDPLTPPSLSAAVQLTLRFPSRTPKGAQEIDVSLVDKSNLESTLAKETVTLQ